MTAPRTHSGHVAHAAPGSLILTPQATALLAAHLRARREPDDTRTALIVADIIRMSRQRPASRDHVPVWPIRAQHDEVDTAEAAQILGLTAAGVRKRIRRGTLPARFDGQRWRVTLDSIQDVK